MKKKYFSGRPVHNVICNADAGSLGLPCPSPSVMLPSEPRWVWVFGRVSGKNAGGSKQMRFWPLSNHLVFYLCWVWGRLRKKFEKQLSICYWHNLLLNNYHLEENNTRSMYHKITPHHAFGVYLIRCIQHSTQNECQLSNSCINHHEPRKY